MLSKRLKQIREQSELIQSSVEGSQGPTIQRSLGQLEKETQSLSEKIESNPELQAKAHYFLARNGINTEYMTTPIDTSQTFAKVQVDNFTDIKEIIGLEHEREMIQIIEDKRKQNILDFQDSFDTKFTSVMQNLEGEIAREKEYAVEYKEFEKDNNTTGIVRVNDYANIVSKLNDGRLRQQDFDLIQQLKTIRNMSELRKAQDCASETWDVIKHIVDKSNVAGKAEGRFIRTYASKPYQDFEAVQTRCALIASSKSWLEKQASQLVNDTLNRNAKSIQIGGNPSFSYRMRAFIDLTFKSASGWSDERLEIVEGLAIWPFIYYLMRCGRLDLAAEFVDTNQEMFAQDRKFVQYFEEYNKDEYNCVSKTTQEAILADYYKLEYGENVIDPYKLIIYKIIGRCELHKKSLRDVIRNTEDYIWLQFIMVREFTNEEAYTSERYRLTDVQKDIASHGSTYFDPDNTNPWIYFRILILTLQFESAIDFLCKQKKYRLDAVHFALALVYHGLLRIVPASASDTKTMLITENSENYFNFSALIYQYIQVFLPQNHQGALQYLFMISVYSQTNGYHDDSMVQLAISSVCKFIVDSKNLAGLIGNADDSTTPGLIEDQAKLLYIDSHQDYINQILYPTAERCVESGRCLDAVHIYVKAQDYNKMVDVLAKELSDALQTSQEDRAIDYTLSNLSNAEIIEFAMSTMKHYEKFEPFVAAVAFSKQTSIRVLIQLLQFRTHYEQREYEKALEELERANVVPLRYEHYAIRNLAEQFDGLDSIVQKNVPEIMLNVMDIFYKTYVSKNSLKPPPRHELKELDSRGKALITFAGTIHFNIPTDILLRLQKASVLMMS